MSRNEHEWTISQKGCLFVEKNIYPREYPDYTVKKISDKERQNTHGDHELQCGVRNIFVDVKTYKTVWDGCLCEIMQDIVTCDLGWWYKLKHCDRLMLVYFRDDNAELPTMVYDVDFPCLRTTFHRLLGQKDDGRTIIRWVMAAGGWGATLSGVIPWKHISDCATLVYGNDQTYA